MHRAELCVLEEVELDVEFPEILKAIAGHPAVRICGQNVRFDPARLPVAEFRLFDISLPRRQEASGGGRGRRADLQ